MTSHMIKTIQADGAPAAAGHYSQGTIAGDLIFTATTLPIDPLNPNKPAGDIKEQTHQVLNNIFAIIRAGGGGIDTIARMTIYLSDINDWDAVNAIYVEKFGDHKPARGVVEIQNIRKGYCIAIDAIAATKS